MKVRWSKNVLEERACPDQVLLAADDAHFCVHLSLAVYFDHWFRLYDDQEEPPSRTYLYTEDEDSKAPKRFNQRFSRNFRALLKEPEFKEVEAKKGGKTGLYGARKIATTYAKQAGGCIQEEIDVRGRWRPHRARASDRYQDVEQPYMDAKVAAALCPGGPIAYKLRDGSGITDAWISEQFPLFRSVFGVHSNVPNVLGRALLWACLDGSLDHRIPPVTVRLVRREYAKVRQLPEGTNPVMKVSTDSCLLCLFYCLSLLCPTAWNFPTAGPSYHRPGM
jgi:hypothetical protein